MESTPVATASEDAPLTDITDVRYSAEHCPSQNAIGMIADKWKLLILIELARHDVLRFKELQRALGTISQKVLTSALRALEADGLVRRTVYAEVPPRVEYVANGKARSLFPILAQLHAWASLPEDAPAP